jgi:KUP system potassium uptake protein
MSTSHKDLHSKLTLGGLLISLGIIYGDIGTSIYVMKAILGTHTINADVVLGGISAVFGPYLQTTIKYVLITLGPIIMVALMLW